MQEYEDLKVLVAEIEADINKAQGGNKAAGTRVRKQMQKIKQAAQLVRNRVLEIRSSSSSCATALLGTRIPIERRLGSCSRFGTSWVARRMNV